MEQTGWFLKPGEVSQSLYPLSRLRDGVTVGVLRQLPHVTGPVFQRELTLRQVWSVGLLVWVVSLSLRGGSPTPAPCPGACSLLPSLFHGEPGTGGGKEGNPRAACSWARNSACYRLKCPPSKSLG